MVETERQIKYSKRKEQVEVRPEKQRTVREKEIRLMHKKFEVPSEESEAIESYTAIILNGVMELAPLFQTCRKPAISPS